jgi:hypothetical protein
MFWPRCQLTPDESKVVSLYFDPEKRRTVIRRTYNGFLVLDATQRQPTFSFQIARRSRVFALTASGDIPQFRIQLQSSSGEQYFPDFVSASNIFGGYNQLPRSAIYPNFTQVLGMPFTLAPFVMEPNIILAPNENLNLIGQEQTPYVASTYRLEVCFHVWEYPGYVDEPNVAPKK